ncbi:HAD family hydrolase [Microbulbifer spongiae]|uniref:HAD family phosphatase n=1 Tax=Microbulbifer spongiae TaxID=2944933 RepID=A0ABY9EH03_9GAMM|nr:HAD family phosphatase [Microbulbifer sp. MI-G]WKD50720.1 HAD family phosphatase [Microbulbifer sp. MI-G]
MGREIEWILFDLGGVLIELSGSPLPAQKMPVSDWLLTEPARSFEKGLISPSEFAHRIKQDLKLDHTVDEILSHFEQWPKGFYPGATELLVDISRKFGVSALSNTNAIHWPRITLEFRAHDYFEHIFASHKIGMAKPEIAFFLFAIETLKIHPKKIVFFDDNASNVATARIAGMQAYLVQGVQSTLNILEGILLSSKPERCQDFE